MPIQNLMHSIRRAWLGTEEMFNDVYLPQLLSSIPFDLSKAESVSTVYICIKKLADTLSRMPLNVYSESEKGRTVNKDDYRYPILHYNPNGYTSSQTFFATCEYWRNLKGNAYSRIYRNGDGTLSHLELISPSKVTGYAIERGELYYTVLEETKTKGNREIKLNASELLHFRTLTKDGILGINPIEAIRLNVSSTWQGLNTIDSFYKNSAISPRAIKSTISGVNQKAMLEALQEFKTKYTGSVNAGTLIPLPPNTDLVDMSMNFADALFLETLKFNAGQIASLYGVPPASVGIFEATKFNNVEMMMLDFKASTIADIMRMYRQELEHKLLSTQERLSGTSIEFNSMALVETDSTTRINNLRTLLSNGVITPNDVAKMEGYETFAGGEKHYIPGNYLAIEDIGKVKSSNQINNSQ
jgi:HK97 family phage portal protein